MGDRPISERSRRQVCSLTRWQQPRSGCSWWLVFLDRHTRELHRDWADEAAEAVASLRYVARQYPDDRALAELVGRCR